MHHDTTDIGEVTVPAVAPSRKLTHVEALGTQHAGQPDRITDP